MKDEGKTSGRTGKMGEKPVLYVAQNENDVARFVRRGRGGGCQGRSWRDHAVLYRMKPVQSHRGPSSGRVPVPYVGGTRFLTGRGPRHAFYLQVLANPSTT
jgi:superfamily I DNA/RNA helicase